MSEVARLRKQIELEYAAGQRALHAPAMVASHEFITVRMERIHQCFEALMQHLPADVAMTVLIAATEERSSESL